MMKSFMDRDKLLEVLGEIKRLARDAGVLILSCRDREKERVEIKPDGSPVTLADREAHDFILSGLTGLDGSIPVISEEDSPSGPLSASGMYWLVDPLDGTLGYLRRDGQFTVNIALGEGGDVLAGVIAVPDSGTVYAAARGAGGSRERGEETMLLDSSLASGELCAALTNTIHSSRMRYFLELNGITRTIKSSSSLKICYVAERRADIYPRFGRTALWDTAAGTVIAREAGCSVEDIQGRPLRHDPSAGIYHHGFMVYDPARLSPVFAHLKDCSR